MSFRNFSSVIKAVDLFAVDVSFRENKGKSFTSILGGAVSIIIYAITLGGLSLLDTLCELSHFLIRYMRRSWYLSFDPLFGWFDIIPQKKISVRRLIFEVRRLV